MKKTIYGIFSSYRVYESNEPFSERELIYCIENKKDALKEVDKLNKEEESKPFPFLEYRYEAQEITLFTK